jgi:hypothetical protein
MVKTSKILSGLAALAMIGFSGSASAQGVGTTEFDVSATLVNALSINCGAGVLSFGSINRLSTYAGTTDTVTIAATTGAEAVTTSPDLLVSGGGVLECTVSGMTDNTATEIVVDGVGDTDVPVTLTGVGGQTLEAELDAVFTGGTTDYIRIGGVLTMKPAGSDPANEAGADTYTVADIALLITD